MDPVEIHETKVATSDGSAAVAPVATAPAATPRTGYAESRVVNPSWLKTSQVIWLFVGIVDVVLALDFLFRALSAHNTGFASVIYGLGGTLASPFDGIFGNTINNAGNGTIGIDRWGDLMAIVIYGLIAVALVKIARIVTTPKDSISSSSTTVL